MNLFESVVDLHTITGNPIYESVLDAMTSIFEAGDLGYTGTLGNLVTRQQIFAYRKHHPECTSDAEAERIIMRNRDRAAERSLGRSYQGRSTVGTTEDLMNSANYTRKGEFVQVYDGYRGHVGKIVDEHMKNGTMMLDIDLLATAKDIERVTVPESSVVRTYDQTLIDRWNRASGIAPVAAPKSAAKVGQSAPVYMKLDKVMVTEGPAKDMEGKYLGINETDSRYADVKINIFGIDRIIMVPINGMVNLSKAERDADKSKTVADGKKVIKGTFPGFRR